MADFKHGREWVSFEPTHNEDSIKKVQVIEDVSQMTGVDKNVVRDVLNAFTHVWQREVITNGVMFWQGLPSVLRYKQENVKRYHPSLDKTLIYPEVAYLRARIPVSTKRLLRAIYQEQARVEYRTTKENWWEPYFYCEGDWRKKE